MGRETMGQESLFRRAEFAFGRLRAAGKLAADRLFVEADAFCRKIAPDRRQDCGVICPLDRRGDERRGISLGRITGETHPSRRPLAEQLVAPRAEPEGQLLLLLEFAFLRFFAIVKSRQA